jgi:hypothetical protein
MNPLKINRMVFSRAVWEAIAPNGLREHYNVMDEGPLLKQADYQTGSISPQDAAELRTIAEYFAPSVIAEVGTYIGRSTRALATGMRKGKIYTCDASNDIDIGNTYGVEIKQFPKTTSTAMFQELANQKVKVDLFYIDGRITQPDVELMMRLSTAPLIVLDDFEGVEKGVANASLLMAAMGNTHFLVYPRPNGKTALMVPQSILMLTAQ